MDGCGCELVVKAELTLEFVKEEELLLLLIKTSRFRENFRVLTPIDVDEDVGDDAVLVTTFELLLLLFKLIFKLLFKLLLLLLGDNMVFFEFLQLVEWETELNDDGDDGDDRDVVIGCD